MQDSPRSALWSSANALSADFFGLYFVCPTPIKDRIFARLGNALAEYSPQPGSITFHDYTIDLSSESLPYPLKFGGSFTTTHDQLALAFSSPQHLPPKDLYAEVVERALAERIAADKG